MPAILDDVNKENLEPGPSKKFRTEDEVEEEEEEPYPLTAVEAERMRGGRAEYPHKDTFRHEEFPRGLLNYDLFDYDGMWTEQDRTAEMMQTHSYNAECKGTALTGEKAAECLKSILVRYRGAFTRPLVSPLTGELLNFDFNDKKERKKRDAETRAMNKSDKTIAEQEAEIEEDLRRTIFHISQFNPELNNAVCSVLGLQKSLRSMKELERVVLSDYLGRVNVIVSGINKAVLEFRAQAGASLAPVRVVDGPRIWPGAWCSYELAKHLVMGSLNRAIVDAKPVNKSYEGFSSCTYGEAHCEQLEIFAKELNLLQDDVVLDLGSGMGIVCMYFAAACEVKRCIGIELNEVVAKAGTKCLEEFGRTCAWYGKTASPVFLEQSDFTHRRFRNLITKEATFIFINNFIFGDELNGKLAKIIADIKPRDSGKKVRIICTKPFVALPGEAKEAERKASHQPDLRRPQRTNRAAADIKNDLAHLLTVRKLPNYVGNASWTAKAVEFFIHEVDHELDDMARRNALIDNKKRLSTRRSSIIKKAEVEADIQNTDGDESIAGEDTEVDDRTFSDLSSLSADQDMGDDLMSNEIPGPSVRTAAVDLNTAPNNGSGDNDNDNNGDTPDEPEHHDDALFDVGANEEIGGDDNEEPEEDAVEVGPLSDLPQEEEEPEEDTVGLFPYRAQEEDEMADDAAVVLKGVIIDNVTPIDRLIPKKKKKAAVRAPAPAPAPKKKDKIVPMTRYIPAVAQLGVKSLKQVASERSPAPDDDDLDGTGMQKRHCGYDIVLIKDHSMFEIAEVDINAPRAKRSAKN